MRMNRWIILATVLAVAGWAALHAEEAEEAVAEPAAEVKPAPTVEERLDSIERTLRRLERIIPYHYERDSIDYLEDRIDTLERTVQDMERQLRRMDDDMLHLRSRR